MPSCSVRRLCSVMSMLLLTISAWGLLRVFRLHQPESIRRLETPAAQFLNSYCPSSHLEVVREFPLQLVVAADCDILTFACLQPALEHFYDIQRGSGESVLVVPGKPPFYWVDHGWLAWLLASLGLVLGLPELKVRMVGLRSAWNQRLPIPKFKSRGRRWGWQLLKPARRQRPTVEGRHLVATVLSHYPPKTVDQILGALPRDLAENVRSQLGNRLQPNLQREVMLYFEAELAHEPGFRRDSDRWAALIAREWPLRRRRAIFSCDTCEEVFVDEESLARHALADHRVALKRPCPSSFNPVVMLWLLCLLAGITGFVLEQREQPSLNASLRQEVSRLVDAPILLALGARNGRVRVVASIEQRLRPLLKDRAQALGLDNEAIYYLDPPVSSPPPLIWLPILGGILFFGGRARPKAARRPPTPLVIQPAPTQSPLAELPFEELPFEELVRADGLSLEIGPQSVEAGQLRERLHSARRQVASELGIPLHDIRFYGNSRLRAGSYVINVNGVEAARGVVMAGHYLAIGPEEKLKNLRGTKTVDPTYGMPGTWVSHEQRGDAERLGCMTFDPVSVVSTQVTEVMRGRVADLLSYELTHQLLSQPHLASSVEQLKLQGLDKPRLRELLRLLLEERVSIRDLTTICDSLLLAPPGLGVESLLESARQALGPQIVQDYTNSDRVLNCLVVPVDLQHELRGETDSSAQVKRLQAWCERMRERGIAPVLVCEPDCRLRLRRLLGDAVVLSVREIPANVEVNSLGE